MQHIFTLMFDVAAITAGLNIRAADVAGLMSDPRVATPVIQRRLVASFDGWTLRPQQGGTMELRDPKRRVWRVKSFVDQIDFPPSAQIGLGREVDIPAAVDRWQDGAGFIIADLKDFPAVRLYMVPGHNIVRWQREEKLGTNGTASRATWVNRLRPDIEFLP